MRKIILLDDVFPTGEQTVQPAVLWSHGKAFREGITKEASEASDYIKHITPEEGKTLALVLALGSEEAYGPNRNGDGFPERPVTAKVGKGLWIKPGEGLADHYKSFEKAHVFKHHQNKDPAKASGHVKKAFWNPKMHRVELLLAIDNEKDAEWVQRLNDGDFCPVSMGCKIAHDVCSRCGNKAPTRAQYCDHAKYAMNQVQPDGSKNYVHNPNPNFFDISRVFRPADRTGYTLKKVAHVYEINSSAELGEQADSIEAKNAAISKLCDIDKIIRGEPVASASNLRPETQKIIRKFKDYAGTKLSFVEIPTKILAPYSPVQVFSTLEKLGMVLSQKEFVKYIVPQLSNFTVSDKLACAAVSLQPHIFGLLKEASSVIDDLFLTGIFNISEEHVSSKLANNLAPYVEKRANLGAMITRNFVPEGVGLKRDEAPTTDIFTYTDPQGRQFKTTRGAMQAAHDTEEISRLNGTLGGAALLGGGYKMLSMHPALGGAAKLPLMAGALYAGSKLLTRPHKPRYMTDQGVEIPVTTEFQTQDSPYKTGSLIITLIQDYRDAQPLGGSLLPLIKTGSVDVVKGLTISLDDLAIKVGSVIRAAVGF